jgi:hypothetical protein
MTHVQFAYEEDLCDVLAARLPAMLVRRSPHSMTHTFLQRPVGTVIPDLIYIRAYASRKQLLPVSGLTALESAIVAALLAGRPLRDVTIARRLYSQVDRITTRLRELERRGVVEQPSDGVWVVRRKTILKRTRVVAVEAKLRRWRDAVQQAASYLAFANQSYVALPRVIAERNDALRAACWNARVGLALVEPKRVTLALIAPTHHPRTADRVWLLSRTLPHLVGQG